MGLHPGLVNYLENQRFPTSIEMGNQSTKLYKTTQEWITSINQLETFIKNERVVSGGVIPTVPRDIERDLFSLEIPR
jgi:hypothetical protein